MTTFQKDHSYCNTANLRFYPKRLIDLRSEQPTLMETCKHDLRDPYANLSHCWVQKPFFTLNKRN
ncbi:hypothetical protein IWX90DRAFT_422993 [Phyllosticta citrichinensis]|uniref:Uncharacterized protein n=1 Tax=Phyllosticta citrichinensis TaxID=1130410 RepID=A0ABR1Y1G8_9PEZI